MKRALAIGLLLACGTLCGCATAVMGGGSSGKSERTAQAVATDAAITADVKARLIAEPGIRSLSINVDTWNGKVTLKGKVATSAQRSTAGKLAGKVRGVKSVQNELTLN